MERSETPGIRLPWDWALKELPESMLKTARRPKSSGAPSELNFVFLLFLGFRCAPPQAILGPRLRRLRARALARPNILKRAVRRQVL